MRPSELESIEEQEAAELTLGFVDTMEMVKLESFLAECRRVYLQDEPLVLSVTHDEKVAQWSSHFHYKHLKLCLLASYIIVFNLATFFR